MRRPCRPGAPGGEPRSAAASSAPPAGGRSVPGREGRLPAGFSRRKKGDSRRKSALRRFFYIITKGCRSVTRRTGPGRRSPPGAAAELRDGRSHSGTVLKPERNRNGAGAEPGAPGTCGRGGRMAAMRCGWPGAAAPAAPQNHLRAGDGGSNLSAEHPPATDEGGTDNRIPVARIAGRPGQGVFPAAGAECHRAGAAADAGRENLPGGCFLTAGMV